MNAGWIKLNRNIVDMKGYFDEKFTRVQCWIDLLLLAEWQPERSFYIRGNKVVVKRGQVAVSLRKLSERWNLSINTVQKRLNELVLDGRIDIQKSNVINLISIINYEKYQDYDTQNDIQSDTQNDTQNDTPIKNINNIKNIHTLTRTRDFEKNSQKEKWRTELEQDAIFWEQTAMSLSCTIEWLKSIIPKFHSESIACEINDLTFSDYRRSFFNYARKELQNTKRNGNNANWTIDREATAKAQRMQEYQQYFAAKLARGDVQDDVWGWEQIPQ